jgi:phosphinothricin acetyltransferase
MASQLIVRPILETDAPAMLAIYRSYVENSVISFEEQVPSPEEYANRVRKYVKGWAGVAAEIDGSVVGYAYGSAHRERSAYRWSVETTVYVMQTVQRRGIGRKLYESLLPALRDAGYCNAFAGVALPNEPSIGLHESVGFKKIGTFPRVGFKFGGWRDVAWFHLALRDSPVLNPSSKSAA